MVPESSKLVVTCDRVANWRGWDHTGGCALLGRQAALRFGHVVTLVGGTVQGNQTRSSSCLTAGVHSSWCRHIGWWHCSRKSNSVVKLLGGWGPFGLVSSHWLVALFKEIKLGRQAAWRLGAFELVSSHWLVALFKEIKLGRQAAWRLGLSS